MISPVREGPGRSAALYQRMKHIPGQFLQRMPDAGRRRSPFVLNPTVPQTLNPPHQGGDTIVDLCEIEDFFRRNTVIGSSLTIS